MNSRLHAIAAAGLLLSQSALPARPVPAEGDLAQGNAPALPADARIKAGQVREAVRQHGVPFAALSEEGKSLQVSNLLNWVTREDKARTDTKTGVEKQPLEFAQLHHTIQFSTVDVGANFKGFTVTEIRTDASVRQHIDRAVRSGAIPVPPGVTNSVDLCRLIESHDAKLETALKRHDYIK